MFEMCHIEGKCCALCGSDKEGTMYCGQKTGENRLTEMKVCPLYKIREKKAYGDYFRTEYMKRQKLKREAR